MTLRDILRFLIIACIFITPFIALIVSSSMFFPFITGKNFTFRILVEVMLGAWLLLMFIDATYRPKFSWILGAAGIFLAVITVADFTGANPFRSFWSNYERMEGLVTHIHLFLFFIIAGSVIVSEQLWNWFWRTYLVASLIVAMNAFSQLAGKSAIHQGSTRLDATLGNATYLAIYALFNIFIAMFLYARSDKKSGFAWLYPVVAVVNLVVLYYTQTRGSLLGLVGGGLLAFLLVAFFDKNHPKLKKYAIGGTVGLIALVGLFVAFRHSAFIQTTPTLERMASISLSDNTTKSRFMIWQMSWEGFKEHPLLGWGQENFLYVFSKHYNPGMWAQEPWFDRSHDVFFDWLIAGGALGLLAYLSLFGTVLYYLWFAQSGKTHFSVLERAILTGMLAGYFIHNIFVFDNLTSYLIFFAVLAYVHTLGTPTPTVAASTQSKDKKGEVFETGDVMIAAVVIAALTFGMIYFVNIRNINANTALINAIQPDGVMIDDGKGGKKIALEDLMDQSLIGTGEAREQLLQITVEMLDPRVPAQVRQQFYDVTEAQLEQELARDGENLRTQSFAATFYARFGQYEKATQHFQKAIELSPTRQSTYIDFAMMYVGLERYADAEVNAKKAFELDPTYPDARVAYATTLIHQKKFAEGETVMLPLKGTANYYNPRIINAYGMTEQYAKILELVNEKIAGGAGEARDYFSLAASYAGLGKKTEALAAVAKAVSLDANLKTQGDQITAQIQKL